MEMVILPTGKLIKESLLFGCGVKNTTRFYLPGRFTARGQAELSSMVSQCEPRKTEAVGELYIARETQYLSSESIYSSSRSDKSEGSGMNRLVECVPNFSE